MFDKLQEKVHKIEAYQTQQQECLSGHMHALSCQLYEQHLQNAMVTTHSIWLHLLLA